VAAHVLAQHARLEIRVAPHGRVQAARGLERGLLAATRAGSASSASTSIGGPGATGTSPARSASRWARPQRPHAAVAGEVALELRPVDDGAGGELHVQHVGRIDAVGGRLVHRDHVGGAPQQPLARHEAQRQLAIVAGRAQRHRERAAVDADLERALHRERVVSRLTRTAGHSRDRPPEDRLAARHAAHTFTWDVRVANVPSASGSSV
jgi:hypothetical protein